jgi:hypothetical protein
MTLCASVNTPSLGYSGAPLVRYNECLTVYTAPKKADQITDIHKR